MGTVTNAVWFGKIGIVQIVQNHQWETYQKTGDADYKYYIGDGLGKDEQNDRHAIACFGMPFDVAAGDKLFRVDRPLKNDWKWDWQ